MTKTQEMASAAATREGPSYSSSRVQRAARLNNVEATKLFQQLQYLEKAKQHQCRVTNQDIRLVSMSIDYIQAHSGNSQEAWRPPPPSPEDETDETNPKPDGPCFMYGERIISRKIRRLARPMSAVERSYGKSYDDDSRSSSTCDDSTDNNSNSNNNNNIHGIPRPKSCGGSRNKNRPSSSMSWLKLNDSNEDSNERTVESTANTARSGFIASRPSSAVSSSAVEREPWEDDTSIITKKILKSQARAQMGKRNSVYQPAGAVLNSQASKKVRDLARKIKINSTQISFNGFDPSVSRHSHPGGFEDKPPKKPTSGKDLMGRRATFSEIMNQQKPMLSAGAWRQHLSKSSHASPMSASAQQKVMLEAKKNFNESRRADVAEKVKYFMVKRNL